MIANVKGYEPLSLKSSQLDLTILKGMSERGDREGVQQHQLDKQTFIVDYLCRQPRILKVLGLENEVRIVVPDGGAGDSAGGDMPPPQLQWKKNLPLKDLMATYYFTGCINIRTAPKRNEAAIKALLNKAMAAWTRKLDRQYNKQINLSLPANLVDGLDLVFNLEKRQYPKLTRNEYLVNLIEREIKFRISLFNATVTSIPISEDSASVSSNPLVPPDFTVTSSDASEEVVEVSSSPQQSGGYF